MDGAIPCMDILLSDEFLVLNTLGLAGNHTLIQSIHRKGYNIYPFAIF